MATTDWKQVGRQLESMGYPQNPAQPPAAQLSPAKPAAPQSGGVIGTANAQTAGPIGQPSPPQTQPVAASPAGNSAQNFMPGTRAVFNESAKSISDLAGQGRYAAAAGETARAALAYVPAIADDVVGGAARAVVPAAVDAGKQFLTGGGSPPTPAPATTPATATLNSALEAQRRRDAINGTGTGQSVPGASPETASAAPVGAGNVTRVGNSYSGTNVTGDSITINGRAPGGGQISEQNMKAAQSLSDYHQETSINRLASRGYAPAVQSVLAAQEEREAQARQAYNDRLNALEAGKRSTSGSDLGLQSSVSQRSPVGMTVEQAQQQGLIGERVGYNPAYDQRINGGRGTGNRAAPITATIIATHRQAATQTQPAARSPATARDSPRTRVHHVRLWLSDEAHRRGCGPEAGLRAGRLHGRAPRPGQMGLRQVRDHHTSAGGGSRHR